MFLSEVHTDDIKIGMRVWSAFKSVQGSVVEVDKDEKNDDEDTWITVRWDNGKESCNEKWAFDQVEVIPKE